MTKEDLLKPRYKVIAAYPHMEMDQHGVGDIISPYGMGFIYPDKVKEQYDSYPHLFKPLQWWEDRDFGLSGMYVRFGDLDKAHSYYQLIEKIDYPYTEMWHMKGRINNHQYPLTDSIPATEQEFLDFINYAQPNH